MFPYAILPRKVVRLALVFRLTCSAPVFRLASLGLIACLASLPLVARLTSQPLVACLASLALISRSVGMRRRYNSDHAHQEGDRDS